MIHLNTDNNTGNTDFYSTPTFEELESTPAVEELEFSSECGEPTFTFGEVEMYPPLGEISAIDTGEVDMYPSLGKMSAVGAGGIDDQHLTSDHWSADEWTWPTFGSPTSLGATNNWEPMDSATARTTPTDGDGQPLYTDQPWPVAGQQTQYYHPGLPNGDGSIPNEAALEMPPAIGVPSHTTLDHWGNGWQDRSSIGTFYVENVHTFHQPSVGPARTRLMPTGRFEPYGTYRSRPSEYTNAEAGPSTLPAPLPPYVGPQMWQPTGGIFGMATNAENDQTLKEEGNSSPQQIRDADSNRSRGQTRNYGIMLRNWVGQQRNLRETPTLTGALAVAVEIIPTIRRPVIPPPTLCEGRKPRTNPGSKNADNSYRKREEERRLLTELCRYYPLGPDDGKWWTRPSLLLKVLEDLINWT